MSTVSGRKKSANLIEKETFWDSVPESAVFDFRIS
jgi:hypothetical protein